MWHMQGVQVSKTKYFCCVNIPAFVLICDDNLSKNCPHPLWDYPISGKEQLVVINQINTGLSKHVPSMEVFCFLNLMCGMW